MANETNVDQKIEDVRDYVARLEKIVEAHKGEKELKEKAGELFLSQFPDTFFNKIVEGKRASTKCHVTVMITDLLGFTEMLDKKNTQEVSVLLNRYFNEMDNIINTHNGWVHKFNGDGMVVIFGLNEDDTSSEKEAYQAGIAMQEKMKDFFTATYGLQMRVGIEAGEVFFDEIRTEHSQRFDCLGMSVNVASRLEPLAKPGGLLFGPHAVEQLKDELKDCDFEELHLKGVEWPIRACHIAVGS